MKPMSIKVASWDNKTTDLHQSSQPEIRISPLGSVQELALVEAPALRSVEKQKRWRWHEKPTVQNWSPLDYQT
jgi:hypothetical protein